MGTDDPKAGLNLLPTFAQPSPPPGLDPTQPDLDPDPEPSLPNGRRWLPFGPSRQRPDDDATPTGTFSRASEPVHKPTSAETALLVAGLVSLIVSGAAWAVRLRTRRGYKLRRPTQKQTESIANPLARLGLRHVDASWLNKDLLDLLAAGAATGAYLTDGELIVPDQPDPGVPADLQETYE